MLERALDWLRQEGYEVQLETAAENPLVDAVLRLRGAGGEHEYVVERRSRSPYPNELPALFARYEDSRQPRLLAVPYVSEGTARQLREAGWSWADEAGNLELRSQGFHVVRRVADKAPRKPRSKRIPRHGGGLAIVRFLISHGEDLAWSPLHLANIAGVSPSRASQVLAALEQDGLVDHAGRGEWTPRRDLLLDAFLTSYQGPGGSEVPAYSLDSPLATALRLCAGIDDRVVVSADVGPDLLVPVRTPTALIVYTRRDLDLGRLALTVALSAAEANVLIRTPADRSVFGHHETVVGVEGQDIALADQTQLLWDLEYLGGEDRREAAGGLRAWLLNR